jgi:hypothetical protein
MLLWIERPTEYEALLAQCGPKKFFCGRKHKFGLNLQGTCDSECRFLDVAIGHPASTSDFLAFTTTKLYRQLEGPGFLAKGLAIFGDSAYVNNGYFVTPFPNVSSGSKDDFNYYHSQVKKLHVSNENVNVFLLLSISHIAHSVLFVCKLRIRIECSFGQLVNRWGILRRAISASIGLRKTTRMVVCLCRLHNFCVNERLGSPGGIVEIAAHGGIRVRATGSGVDGDYVPEDLMGSGHHNDDTSRAQRRLFARSGRSSNGDKLPRDELHWIGEKGGFRRPETNKSKK